MAYLCDRCGKGMVYGSSQTHRRGVAGKRWNKRANETKRTFSPNLQKFEGRQLCTSCIKKVKSERSIAA